jgi:hypothetical protein
LTVHSFTCMLAVSWRKFDWIFKGKICHFKNLNLVYLNFVTLFRAGGIFVGSRDSTKTSFNFFLCRYFIPEFWPLYCQALWLMSRTLILQYSNKPTNRQTNQLTCKQTNKHTNRQTNQEANIQIDKQTYKHSNKPTNLQTN